MGIAAPCGGPTGAASGVGVCTLRPPSSPRPGDSVARLPRSAPGPTSRRPPSPSPAAPPGTLPPDGSAREETRGGPGAAGGGERATCPGKAPPGRRLSRNGTARGAPEPVPPAVSPPRAPHVAERPLRASARSRPRPAPSRPEPSGRTGTGRRALPGRCGERTRSPAPLRDTFPDFKKVAFQKCGWGRRWAWS